MKPADGARLSPLRSRWILFLSLALYAALLVPTLRHQGVYWDEQVDLDVARSFLAEENGWLRGSSFDASQSRLPMFLAAVVMAISGTTSILAARWLSLLVGALTLLGVHRLGRAVLGEAQAALATLLLATSPYYLSFARVGLTESDIFITCAMVWLLICMHRLCREQSLGWVLACGVAMGLAVSSKLTAVSLLPLALFIPALAPVPWGASGRTPVAPRELRILFGALGVLLAGIAQAWWWGLLRMLDGRRSETWTWFVFAFLAVGLAAWLVARRDRCVGRLAAGPVVVALAGITFFLVPPCHLLQSELLVGLAKHVLRSARDTAGGTLEYGAFFTACVLFKSSPLVGALLLVSPLGWLARFRSRPGVRLLLAALALYLLCLLRLPLAQTFYLMPIFPILALAASDQAVRLARIRPRLAVAVGVAASLLLTADLARCYPDYNLSGYQYLGARRLAGRSTLGYAGVAQVTTDGVEQSLRWVSARAGAEDAVIFYALPTHIVRAVCPNPPFRLVNGLRTPAADLRDFDYVVLSIGAELYDDRGLPPPGGEVFGVPYDRDLLLGRFRKVFSVRRAFGVEVASVWWRDPESGSVAPSLRISIFKQVIVRGFQPILTGGLVGCLLF